MICRTDDTGGIADAGAAPASDSGGAPPPPVDGLDTQPPTVTITSPAHNAQVAPLTKVVVQAKDDRAVVRVELLVGAALMASQNATPYTFTLSLQPGTHQLTAVAHDKAGNKGQASVTVTVPGAGPPPTSDSGATPDGETPPAPDGGTAPAPGPAGGGSASGTGCSLARGGDPARWLLLALLGLLVLALRWPLPTRGAMAPSHPRGHGPRDTRSRAARG